MEIQGKTYQERVSHQVEEWAKGNSIHNNVDNECCPDFSCCNPNSKQPEEIRETFLAVYRKSEKEDMESENTPWMDKRMSMLGSFLNGAIATVTDKKVHICDGSKDTANKDLN